VALAAVARLAAGPLPWDGPMLLWAAAGAWSLAYAVTASALLFHR